VPLIAEPVPLVAVKPGTLPVPLAAKPIAVLLFVHVKVVPAAGLAIKAEAGTDTPAHTVISAGFVTVGTGFTVTV